jgi:DNA-binding beta-propeller fold protein YncE
MGTAIDCPGLLTALANPRGVCASGSGGSGGSGGANLFIASDTSNNFGALETGTGAFHSMAQLTAAIQGLAYDRNIDRFYGIDPSRNLFSIRPDNGVATYMGTVVGSTQPINGLGYDPDLRRLYGIGQANGQLYLISTTAMIATTIGSPQGGNMGGLDFDHFSHTLYGLDDTASGTRLMRVSTANGAWTFVGWLGAGATDCNGLAFNPNDHHLYTVNAPTGQLLSIDPNTGAAAIAGPTGGVFGAGFGMAARELTCSADFNHDGDSATDQDIEAFFRALAGQICATCGSPDFNGDGDSGTDADIESFFRVLAGGPC